MPVANSFRYRIGSTPPPPPNEGEARQFIDEVDNKPKAILWTGEIVDFVGPQGPNGIPGSKGDQGVPGTMNLQPEVETYRLAIIANGGNIDLASLSALDRFVVKGKEVGWWNKLREVGPLMGTNLASAAVKLKHRGNPLLAYGGAQGFAESDYSPTYGLTASKNTSASENSAMNQYVDCTYNPHADGLTYQNLSFAGWAGEYRGPGGTNFGGNYSLNVSTGADRTLYVGGASTKYMGTTSTTRARYGVQVINLTTRVNFYKDGLSRVDPANTTVVDINGPLEMFRAWYSATSRYWGNGTNAFYCIGGALTVSECHNLYFSIEELMESTGRGVHRPSGGLTAFIGDSNTDGQGATSVNYHFAEVASRTLGGKNVNLGVPSASLYARSEVARLPSYVEWGAAVTLLKPKITFVVLGTNDMAFDANADGSAAFVADYQAKCTTLLQECIAAGSRVVACSPPYGTARNVTKSRKYAGAVYAASVAAGSLFLDLDRAVRDRLDAASLLVDMVHLSNFGHSTVARLMIMALQGIHECPALLDFPSIAAQSSHDLTVELLGAKVGDYISINPPANLPLGISVASFVSSDNTITVRCMNITTATIDPPAGVYYITARKSM